jgi:hypothetical protein
MITQTSYNTTLNFIADSIDVFGLGFTLQFMANCFKRANALSLEDFTRLSAFFNKMYDFNPLTRVVDIDVLLNEYENILLQIGILTRLNKSFENNTLANKPPAPPVIIAETKSNEKSGSKHLSPELQDIADKDPIIKSIKCPEGKELNPLTKRCVKICKEGYERNDKFKCRKTRKIKSIKIKSAKKCSDDKELNPRTNRCVIKCKSGFDRDKEFHCCSLKRIKTKKHPLASRSSTNSRSRSNINL